MNLQLTSDDAASLFDFFFEAFLLFLLSNVHALRLSFSQGEHSGLTKKDPGEKPVKMQNHENYLDYDWRTEEEDQVSLKLFGDEFYTWTKKPGEDRVDGMSSGLFVPDRYQRRTKQVEKRFERGKETKQLTLLESKATRNAQSKSMILIHERKVRIARTKQLS